MSEREAKTLGGKLVSELSLENIMAGRLNPHDLRISAETLLHQAELAERAGCRPLAQNFRRAAELTGLSNRMVLDIYDLLRPGRASYEELIRWADRLEREKMAPLNAALIRQAAEVYKKRGLLKGG